MKHMKRIASLLLALVMVLSLATTAFAAADKTSVNKITINNEDENQAHTYEAYQIFVGNYNGTNLVDLEWGTNVKALDLLKALEADYKKTTDTDDTTTAIFGTIFKDIDNKVPAAVVDDPGAEGTDEQKAAYATYVRTMNDLAVAVADALAANTTYAEAFAEFVGQNENDTYTYLTGTPATSKANETTDEGGNKTYSTPYTIEVTGDGYYLIKDQLGSQDDNAEEAYTEYMLQVIGNTEVTETAKDAVPEVDKTITGISDTADGTVTNETANTKANDASVGDYVHFQWVGKMPSNIDDYDTYFYEFTDTLSKGFDLNVTYANGTNGKITSGVTVKIGDVDVTEYFYIESENGYVVGTGTTFTVTIKDLKALDNADAENKKVVEAITKYTQVVVTYSAQLNEHAVVGVEGNKNDVDLKYSNDPSDDGDPSNNPPEKPESKPTTDNPTGETPKSETYTFNTGIKLIKVDGITQNRLSGATFKIEGEGVNWVVTYKEEFTKVEEDGTHYLLKDGTYTTEAPRTTEELADAPEGTPADELFDADGNADPDGTKIKLLPNTEDYAEPVEKLYTMTQKTEVVGDVAAEVPVTVTVGTDGVLEFKGLAAGNYTITETVAPDGYNLLKDPIDVNITWSADETPDNTTDTDDLSECSWTATAKNGEKTLSLNEDGIFELTVENKSGTQLPTTGGMGTTLFYVFGGIMVLAAVVLLVTKKRMSVAE